MNEMDGFLTVKQVASWLGMSAVWVYKATGRGELPFLRVGDAIRFDPVEIKSYLEKRRNLKRENN